MATNPADARGYVDLGILLARAGNTDDAQRVFERGLAVLPGHPDLEKNLFLLIGKADQ